VAKVADEYPLAINLDEKYIFRVGWTGLSYVAQALSPVLL
jgi:hypothetical protein